LTVPITLVGGAFGSVILSELSSNIRDNQDSTHRNATIIRTFSKYLFYFSTIFTIVTLLFGSAIFKLIFNDNWLEASRLVGYLAVPFGVSLLWQPLMSVYFASQQWNKYLKISISRLVLSTAAAALAIILEFDWIHVTFAFFIGNSIVQIHSVKDVFKVLRNPAKD
jgi:O-antigen/teichoic acid export membrane protein